MTGGREQVFALSARLSRRKPGIKPGCQGGSQVTCILHIEGSTTLNMPEAHGASKDVENVPC